MRPSRDAVGRAAPSVSVATISPAAKSGIAPRSGVGCGVGLGLGVGGGGVGDAVGVGVGRGDGLTSAGIVHPATARAVSRAAMDRGVDRLAMRRPPRVGIAAG